MIDLEKLLSSANSLLFQNHIKIVMSVIAVFRLQYGRVAPDVAETHMKCKSGH